MSKIFKELDKIWLEEQARFNKHKRDRGDPNKTSFERHYEDHGIPLGLTEEEYDDVADALSEYPAYSLNKGNFEDVKGYITQKGIRVKFIGIKGNTYALVAYTYDDKKDVSIDALTYHHLPLNQVLNKANPYHKLNGKDDYRYKSDIDGRLEGLKLFEDPKYQTKLDQEEIKEQREAILKGERLPY